MTENAFLHVLEEYNFPESFGDCGLDIFLHFTCGMTTEAGVDMAVAIEVECFGQGELNQALPFGKKWSTPSISEVSQT